MADSFHRTRSSPDGKPIIGCIRNAIADAGLTPDDIDYINPHGTGTPENDKMEYARRVGGVRRARQPDSDLVEQIDDRAYAVGRRRGRGGVHAADARAPAHPADHQLSGAGPGHPARRGAEHGAGRQSDATRSRTRSASAARTSRWSWRASPLDRRATRPHKSCNARPHPRRRPQARTRETSRRRRRPARARCRSASRRSRSTTSTSGAGAAWRSPSARCRWSSARKRPAKSRRSAPASPARSRPAIRWSCTAR